MVCLAVATAFLEDSGEKLRCGFRALVLGPPCFGQPALDGGLENRGPVALQVAPHPLQSRNARIEIGEKFLDFLDNAMLFAQRGNGDANLGESAGT